MSFTTRMSTLIGNYLKPILIDEVSNNEVYALLKSHGAKHIFLSDEKYKTISHNSIKQFLRLDLTDKVKYVPIWHDCDDFSFRLMGQFHRGKWSGVAVSA